jgi:hypothetical protein
VSKKAASEYFWDHHFLGCPRCNCSFLCLDVKKGTERKIKASDNFRAHYFLFAHALQLGRYALSNSNAYSGPLQQTRNNSLFPEIL